MDETLAYWTNERLDERNAGISVPAERQEEILADIDGLGARQGYEYEREIRRPAETRLREAVLGDIRRRDAVPGGHGWDDARETTMTADPREFSSFRRSHAALMEMIAIDYDGYADERTRQGDAERLASLAEELIEMATYAYANVPSLYYPMQIEDGAWRIDDVMSRSSHRGRLLVPVTAFMPRRLADETPDEIHSAGAPDALAMQWWAAFLESRADEADRGLLVPLPEVVAIPRCDEQEVTTTDGDVMIACSDAIRHWESVKDDVASMAEAGDSPSLCSVIDEIVRLVAGK